MQDKNFFRHLEVIEAGSAQELASILKSIKSTFQLNQVWSDGKNHYAMINPGGKLPARDREKVLATEPSN